MKFIYPFLISVCLIFIGPAFAEPVNIIKTFDSDRIVDYQLFINYNDHKIKLFYTLEKSDGQARIKYDPAHQNFKLFDELKPLLIKLIKRADEIHKGKIIDFISFEFLGCNDFAKNAILAFHDSQVWKKYLVESKKKYVKPPYEYIKKKMIQDGIFNELITMFSQLGYDIEFSSFEKLAVRKASQFSFYNELVQYGIEPGDEFPIPLMLYFEVAIK